ncbi:hypothetical protein EDC01DRAFT_640279 [Geopyxis carbonaria]|nr:hypothetical protein EDC01DRAFT_640279 [Geopyxis carbonaria]
MVVSIRLPSESNLPHHYTYTSRRHSSTFFSPRIWRRVLPLAVLFILFVETYRFFDAPFAQPPASDIDSVYNLPGPEPATTGLKTLVIVACHSIWLGGASLGTSAAEWILEPYQSSASAPASFLAHINAGITAVQSDPSALLVFSGGETRPSAGPLTEAGSYYALAMQRGLISDDIRNRTTTELGATDSYQNLLFSLCRFREVTGGNYPEKIVVVSFGFKRERFVDLHRAAVGWPVGQDQFEFIAAGDPDEGIELVRAMEGERRTRILWEKDAHGCQEKGLGEKRRTRNWGRRTVPYELSCPELKGLLNVCVEQREVEQALLSTPWRGKATL